MIDSKTRRTLYLVVSALTVLVIGSGVTAWLTGLTKTVTIYDIFPIFGLCAFGLMWMHYISGSLKRYWGLEGTDTLKKYFTVTSYAVLALILIHPSLLYAGLLQDGYGFPPLSAFNAYTTVAARIAIVMGEIALVSFLLFELRRWFAGRTWWKYIEYLNILAMALIFMHGLILGGELMHGWFRLTWIIIGWVLALSIIYNYWYDANERKKTGGRERGSGFDEQ